MFGPDRMDQLSTFVQPHLGIDTGAGLILELFIVVFLVVTINTLVRIVLWRLYERLQKSGSVWDDALVDALRRPFYLLTWIVGLSIVVEVFQNRLDNAAAIFEFVPEARALAVIVLMTWFLLRVVNRVEHNLVEKRQLSGKPYDLTTMDAVSKLIRLSVVITATLVGMQTLGFNISGVLAFGGVGGIAVGFAARDLLANFFGGLMVYLDRPFNVGDWIRSPDRDIEGTVEHIGWRQTRIRTFDQRPLYVPNSTFATVSVENPSRMLNRRIFETVGIRYEDAEHMDGIVHDVRAMIEAHEDLETASRPVIVNFTTFGPSSLDFFIYCFTKTTNWVEYHGVKQDVLLRVLEIVSQHGAQVAFPTSTLHVPKGLRITGGTDSPPPDENQAAGKPHAAG